MPLRLGVAAPQQVDLTPMTAELEALAQQVLAASNAAAAADARAANAQQMVRNDRPAIEQAQTTAAAAQAKADAVDVKRSEYEAALTASVNDRAAIHTALDALAARLTALEAAKVAVAYGTANVAGSLLAGASTNVTVTLSRNMGTGYSIGYGLAGGTSLLGQLAIAGVAAQTPTTVTLTVRNTGLTALASLAGAVVHVVAAKEG